MNFGIFSMENAQGSVVIESVKQKLFKNLCNETSWKIER